MMNELCLKFEIPQAAYIHIPFCRRRCYYCDFPISVVGNQTDLTGRKTVEDYTSALCQEILHTSAIASGKLKTVFFGGGTPSLLPIWLYSLSQLQRHYCDKKTTLI